MIKFDKNEFLKPQIYSTLDEYESRCNVTKEIIEEIEQLQQENEQLKEEKRKVRDYIKKHCVNEEISKEVGYKCYTMADTNELEKIMKILGDK